MVKGCNRNIICNRQASKNTTSTTVLCDHADTIADGIFRALDIQWLSIQLYFAAGSMADTKNGLHQLCTLCSNQTAESKDLTSSQLKGTVLERIAVNAGKIVYFKKYISRCVIKGRINICKLTAYHVFNNIIITDVFHFPCTNISTVSHDGNIIRDLTKLCHLMGNKYKGHASVT